ncbi:MAG: maleylpyruvate isomerase N-terminal domain-containing protein, partial [Actinomycetota bacterium]|nr:maleylpyruvate isomerase N-terminal domain-containing protein [Actinomycetota bacterium]
MNSPDFGLAADALVSLVGQIGPTQWDQHGLGEWTVRDLVGHASRSLSTIEQYLANPPDPDQDLIDDPLPYLLALAAGVVDPAAVAQRGRDAGAALGEDP